MKNTLFLLMLVCLLLAGCSSNEDLHPTPDSLDISEVVLPKSQFISVLNRLEKLSNPALLSSNYQKAGEMLIEESELINTLNPLLENGLTIHSEFKSQIYNSDLYATFSHLEKAELHAEIEELNDDQLVELSFIVNVNYYRESLGSENIDWDRVISCAGAAVGITAIKEIINNSLKAATVETMMGALRHVGKRYLGWIGVGLMIYEFVKCVY